MTVGIDHKQNKFINQKADEKDELKAKMDLLLNKKRPAEKKGQTHQNLITSHEDELLFLVNQFDLSNLTEEQLKILSCFNKIFDEMQQASIQRRMHTDQSESAEPP